MPGTRRRVAPSFGLPQRIDLHVHFEQAALEAKVDQVLDAVNAVLKLGGKLMTKAEDLKTSVGDLTSAFRDATDEIAKDLQDLRDKVAAGLADGLTAAEAADLQAAIDTQLGAARDRLVELGKDPENPVP